jgi:hypothetical protein
MSNQHEFVAEAQSPPLIANAVAAFNDAIRNARLALISGPLGSAIVHLEDASRLAAEVKNLHAHELANLASALSPAFETVKLVEKYLDVFPEQ